MKFDKLFKIVTEAKGSKKNRGGGILNTAKKSEGPMGLPASSAGFADNPQLRAPSNKWDFDSNKSGGEPLDELADATTGEAITPIKSKKGAGEGFKEQSKLWRDMLNVVGLLLNDPDFNGKFHDIADTFGKSLDSFKNLRQNAEGEQEKYDEEAKLDSLHKIVTKYAGELTEIRDEIQTMLRLKKQIMQDAAEQDSIVSDMGSITGQINSLKTLIKKYNSAKNANPAKAADLEKQVLDLENQLYDLDSRNANAQLNPTIYDDRIKKLQDKLVAKEEISKAKQEELEELSTRIDNINTTNETANSLALDEFDNLVKTTAKALADQYLTKLGEAEIADPNWDDVESKQLAVNVAKLRALTSDDPQINPLIKYLQRFKRNYEDREFNISHALDKNTNITKIRDRNRLPFMILSNMYSNINLKKPIRIDYGVETPEHKKAIWNLEKFLTDHAQHSPVTEKKWGLPGVKDYLIKHINNLALSTELKNNLMSRVSDDYGFAKSGANSFQQLLGTINSYLSQYKKTTNESFDKTVSKILREKRYDVDDLKIDTIEVLNSIKRHK